MFLPKLTILYYIILYINFIININLKVIHFYYTVYIYFGEHLVNT